MGRANVIFERNQIVISGFVMTNGGLRLHYEER